MSFFKQSLSTFATQVVSMFFGIGAGIVTARILGPTLKGQAALLTMISQVIFMLCSMGLGSAFSFQVAKQRFEINKIITAAAFLSVVFGSVGILVFYLSLPLHASVWDGIPAELVFYAALLSIVCIFANYLTRIVVGYGRIYSMNVADFSRTVTNFMAIIVFVWMFGMQLDGMMLAYWLAPAVQLLVLLYVLREDLRPVNFFKRDFLKATAGYGCKSHALLIINFLNYRVDMLLLKHFMTATEVGYYSLAVGMAELMWLVPNSAVAPLFSEVAASDNLDRSLLTLRTARWSLIFLIILAFGGVFFGRTFIALLYGANFLSSFEPFLWLLPGICLFPLFKLLTVDLAARGNPGYGTIASAVALLVNVGANILLIPHMGMNGAALATSISYSFMSLLSLFFFLRETGYALTDVFIIPREERRLIMHFITRFLERFKSKGRGEK
jgi:O-antigen/teichoic acid export membrane protein